MAEETGDTRVVINHRTLRIGRENYALNNIARVQVIGVKPPPDAGQGNAKLGCMSAFGVFVLFSILTASTQSGALATIGFVAAIAVGIVVFIKSKKAYTPRYALMLESTGNPKARQPRRTVRRLRRADRFHCPPARGGAAFARR
jgi:hypothetical protein